MDSSEKLYKMIDRGREGKNIGLPTGLNKLDKYTGGTLQSTYYLYFGLSGSGKSSIVLYSHIYRPLKDNFDKDFKIIYFSLEMSQEVLLAKLLCLYIYEEYNEIISFMELMSRQTILNDKQYELVLKSKHWLDSAVKKHLLVYDKSLSAESFYAIMMENLKKWGSFSDIENGRRHIYIPHNPDQLVACVIDHMGLARSIKGRDKKQEIDEISLYAVTMREKCGISIFAIMQENRNASNSDRRKMEMSEPTAEDIKDSGNVYNDCEVCIGLYYPLKHKIANYRDYAILGKFQGDTNCLRDRFRSAILMKNRFGSVDKVIGLNFFGEIGLFQELPEGKTITDYTQYTSLKDKTTEIEPVEKQDSIKFNYTF